MLRISATYKYLQAILISQSQICSSFLYLKGDEYETSNSEEGNADTHHSYVLLLQAQQSFVVSSVLSDHFNTHLFCANTQTLAVD